MFRKTISWITLVALMLNMMGMTGCARLVSIPAEKVSLDPPKRITRFKMQSGGYLVWNNESVEYSYGDRIFKGVTIEGADKRIRLQMIDSVYFVHEGDTVEHVQERQDFHRDHSEKRRYEVRGDIRRLICDSGPVNFEKHTAVIDTTNQAVIGVTKQGDTLSVPLGQVRFLQVRRGSTLGTIAVILGVGTIFTLIIGAIVISQMDFSFGMGNPQY